MLLFALLFYEGAYERKVDRFLRHLKRRNQDELNELIQEDLVRLTVFLEYKFKAYKRLNKRRRRQLYRQAQLIADDFQRFLHADKKQVALDLKKLTLPESKKNDEKFQYLLSIMRYLKPGKRLKYKESSTFAKLLVDPDQQMLVGDCNQIVTLYIYLFSKRYSVLDLQLKILSGHICLHYRGQDIETTSGELANYSEYLFIAPVTEIVTTNTLDVSDPDERQFSITAKNMLEAAQLAYKFSSHRSLVERNLLAVYHNMAIYHAGKNNFKKAVSFANKSGNTRLQKQVIQMQANHLLRQKKYQKACHLFSKVGDTKGEQACYQNELFDLHSAIKNLKTVGQYKKVKPALTTHESVRP